MKSGARDVSMGHSASKNPKIKKNHNRQKMFRIGISIERVPKNFEQFQTCDFLQKFEKLAQICGQAAVLKKISFFLRTEFSCPKKTSFFMSNGGFLY